ncbi:MAG: T9SS type A sorting domain-containing protein [Bacteroidia bacterium]
MIKKIKLLLLFIITANILQAQESPFGFLRGNAEIIEYRKHLPKQNTQILNKTQSTSTVSLILPFYDEFSYQGPYPDSTKWQKSQSVYVNRTKAIAPPTMGVATFDGLNKYGYPYDDSQMIICPNTGNGLSSYASDTMTSMPIRLDSIPAPFFQKLVPADSIYLSFYYQPKGYFEAPEGSDNLYLDLYSPLDTTWNTVWQHSGYTPTDSSWHLVMIPMIDTAYFHKNFQFRFRNLSAASGDVDHWHIDVVSLKANPIQVDTTFGDFSLAYDLSSTLKNYTQMPFQQYTGATDLKTNINAYVRNNYNDNSHENITTYYECYNNTTNSYQYNTPSTGLGASNLGYFPSVGYLSVPSMSNPTLNYSYPALTAVDSFTIKYYLKTADNIPSNDTAYFHQIFNNYYAYDDGSAEAGFGICSDYVAVKYTLNKPDVLRSMDIFFEPVLDVKFLETTSFRMVVWADSAGFPRTNNPIYKDTIDRYPYFATDTVMPGTQRINAFLRYQLQVPQPLNGGTTFYIGIIPNSNNLLAIGFDRNTNFYQNMFRHTGGAWYVFPAAAISDYGGSLMMRPVLGDSLSALGIKEYAPKSKANFTLYPNPAQDYVFIQSESNIAKVVVTDLLGNTILQQTGAAIKTINTLSLQSGVYLIKAFTDKGFTDTQKLIIAR